MLARVDVSAVRRSTDCSELSPAQYLNTGRGLKGLRRQRGMSQIDVADVLNVSQSNVSRWESGREPIPHQKKLVLQGLLCELKEELSPSLKRLVGRDPDVSVFLSKNVKKHLDFRWLHLGADLAGYFGISESVVRTKRSADVFDPSWRSCIYNIEGIGDSVLVEFERDCVGISKHTSGKSCRLHSTHTVVDLDGYAKVTVSVTKVVGKANGDAPRLLRMVKAENLPNLIAGQQWAENIICRLDTPLRCLAW
jgi:DNA-binding transcriptional regulator YiaG